MVEFGKSLDPDEEYDVLFNILDFPIECVEGDEVAADWDISKAQFLGPIPSSVLMEPPMPPNEEFDAPNLLPQPAAPIAAAPEHVGTHIPGERRFAKVQSPVSVLESNGSSSRGKSLSAISEHTIPARSRSKRVRYSGTNPWILAAHELSTSKRTPNAEKSKQSRKRLCQQPVSIDLTRNTSENVDNSSTISDPADQGASNALVKKCSHCQSTKTPQWRDGPLGPKTLCNACGVRYRSGRLFPEYRPAASPTFVPSQHSNSHRKVVEMRNEAKQVKVEAKVAPLSTQAAAKQVKVETKISGAPVQKQLTKHVEQMQLAKDVDTSSSLQIAPTPKRDEYDDTSSSHISLQNKSVMVQESCASSTQSRASLLQSNSYLRYRAKYTELAGLNPCLPPSPSKKPSNSMKVPIAVSVDVTKNFPQNDSTSLDVTDPVRLQNASNSMRGNKERRTKKLSQLQKVVRKCAHCQSKNKTHWREGPLGPLMLRNACGLRYRSGRLLPESRQAASPMFVPYQTSNSHGEILQMRGEAMQSRDDTEMISGAPVQKQLTEHVEQMQLAKHIDTSSSLEIAPTPKRKLLAEYADTHISDIPLQNKSAEVQESCASSTRSRVSLLESSSYLRYRSKYAKLAGVSPCLPPSPCKKASKSTKKSFEVPIAVPVDAMKNSPKNDDTSLDVSEPARLQNASNSVRHKESRKKKLSQLLMDVDVMKSSHKSKDSVSDPTSLQKVVKKCAHCQSKKTTQWRGGPLGASTLCNPCGLRYKSGRLFPEYRPAASPTFMPYQTSNSHREVMKMRIEAMQSRDDDTKVTLTSPQPDFVVLD